MYCINQYYEKNAKAQPNKWQEIAIGSENAVSISPTWMFPKAPNPELHGYMAPSGNKYSEHISNQVEILKVYKSITKFMAELTLRNLMLEWRHVYPCFTNIIYIYTNISHFQFIFQLQIWIIPTFPPVRLHPATKHHVGLNRLAHLQPQLLLSHSRSLQWLVQTRTTTATTRYEGRKLWIHTVHLKIATKPGRLLLAGSVLSLNLTQMT